MLADTWKAGETRMLYLDTWAYANGTKWNVRVATSDGCKYSITNYPFTDMKSGKFEISDDHLLYVAYTSASSGAQTSTLEAAQSYRKAAEAPASQLPASSQAAQ